MYSVADFGWMIRDKVRTDAYARALKSAITPGCTVLDLGAGTGIFSLLACQFGAGKVYAIEPNDSLMLARTFARDNGYADRIEFFQELSTNVSLKHKADVLIADLHGILPFNNGSIQSMIDARERLLAPGACLIPLKDTLHAAVYSSAVSYRAIENPWLKNDYGLNLKAGARFAYNRWNQRGQEDASILTDTQCWGEIDYRSVSQCDLSGQVRLIVQTAGTAHGISVWFDAELAQGIGFSNAPEAEQLVYGGVQFPWPRPVELNAEDEVSIRLAARRGVSKYLWRWQTEIFRSGSANRPSESFNQSSFHGELVTPQLLSRTSEDFIPTLSEDGKLEALVIGLMDGTRSNRVIAEEVHRQFPHRFPELTDALARVLKLSRHLTA